MERERCQHYIRAIERFQSEMDSLRKSLQHDIKHNGDDAAYPLNKVFKVMLNDEAGRCRESLTRLKRNLRELR